MLHDLDLHFKGQILIVNISEMESYHKNLWESFVDFDICYRNGINSKVILCYPDLLFEGQKFKILISLKR